MSLPYRWHPSGTHFVSDVQPGMLWPHEHVVYRVIEVNSVPESEWSEKDAQYARWESSNTPRMVVVRPVNITSTDVRARDHDRHFRFGGERKSYLEMYADEHYPVCAECLEPLPCRSTMAERVSAASIADMSRYEMAGVCPGCGEVVTARQASRTWPDNVVIPHGPPITYHLRGKCIEDAARYEKSWVAADPERRRTALSCKGNVTNHNDGTYECTELTECPGPSARHPGYSVCRCPDCHARGRFGCQPSVSALNAALVASREEPRDTD